MSINTYYQKIYDYLREEISEGKFSAGDKIPTELELSKQFGVSRITSKKALKMLEEEGYIVRFRAKGSFVTDKKVEERVDSNLPSKNQLIGIVFTVLSDGFGQRMLRVIEKTCKEFGYHLIIKFSHDSAALEIAAIKEFVDIGVAGIIIQPVRGEYYNEEIIKLALEKKNLVFIDRKTSGIYIPSIISNNIDGAKQAIEYLFDLGHKNIAIYVDKFNGNSAVEERWEGCCNAFIKAKMPINSSYFCIFSDHEKSSNLTYKEIIQNHLREYPEVTAAFSLDYHTAYLIKAAAESIGRKVPDDLSIICFDMPSYFTEFPPFTCVYQDEDAIGKMIIESLHNLIKGKRECVSDIIVPVQLIIGQSTAEIKHRQK